MEHSPRPIRRDANPAPRAFAEFCPDTPQQRFDFAPPKIGGRRLCEDASQSPSMPAVHPP
jgi:hypothetical protein